MVTAKRIHQFALTAAVCLVLAACASRPVLQPKSATVPPGVDLTGTWQISKQTDRGPMPTAGGNRPIVIPPENSRQRVGTRPSRRPDGSAIHVFIESGRLLKISQTAQGLFISFDRAIVEEYTFGENRVVSVGPIEAQRVSGWEDSTFVIETLDTQGTLLTESWEINLDDDVLIRHLLISKGDKEQFSSEQRFDRS